MSATIDTIGGKTLDIKPTIEGLLDEAAQKRVFEDNARALFGDVF